MENGMGPFTFAPTYSFVSLQLQLQKQSCEMTSVFRYVHEIDLECQFVMCGWFWRAQHMGPGMDLPDERAILPLYIAAPFRMKVFVILKYRFISVSHHDSSFFYAFRKTLWSMHA